MAQVLVKDENNSTVDEIKFSDGSNGGKGTKKYHIEVNSKSWLTSCETLTGRIVTLSTATATAGQPVNTPENTGYASEFQLHFESLNDSCLPYIEDTVDVSSYKTKFILSNRPRIELDQSNLRTTAVLYAGIGNIFVIEVGGVQQVLPIEPVGVVILAIDGLRQDVLYPDTMDGQAFENVNEPEGNKYYVDARTLSGLGQILIGNPQVSASQRYVMLPKVTTIFPSITFAAWASILTGTTPNGTGILGNEFFARDMLKNYELIRGMYALPLGMVTLDGDGGAFRPIVAGGTYSLLSQSLPFILKYIMPADFDVYSHPTLQSKFDDSASGHALRINVKPLWSEINVLVDKRYQRKADINERCDKTDNECRTVTILNQYAEGADWWGTPSEVVKSIWDSIPGMKRSAASSVMDSFAADETAAFISKYFSNNNPDGKRKRFPALLSVYLSGLDHYAHVEGMGGYWSYFVDVTDAKVQKIVESLKAEDEFDNKIFVIVADHGETAMPTELKYKKTKVFKDETGIISDPWVEDEAINMDCTLKTDFQAKPDDAYAGKNAMKDELSNNNLHIWELGDLFYNIGDMDDTEKLEFAVMAPKEIARAYNDLTSGAKQDTDSANVVAALNGPMAHIYVKNRSTNLWSSPRLVEDIGYVAELLRLTLSTNKSPSNLARLFPVGLFEIDVPILSSTERLENSVDFILIRKNNSYEVFYGIKADGSDVLSAPLDYSADFGTSLYANAIKRISAMNNPDRSGDIVIVMRDFTTGSAGDRFTTAYACKSWHGSLNPSDSFVPLIVSYPGGNKIDLDHILQNISVCPSGQCEGNWNMPSIIKEFLIDK